MSALLLSTLHDPEARLLPFLTRLQDSSDRMRHDWDTVQHSYVAAVVVPSSRTDSRTSEALAEAGWIIAAGQDGPDRGLWSTVETGLSYAVERIHFCDLDRFVHWLSSYPTELMRLPEQWDAADLTMLVRSPRAFASHPLCQVLTEGPANLVIANRLGMGRADAFSGSYVWSRRAAEALRRAPSPRDLRFYAEAVLAPFRDGCSVSAVTVEGLEWETPDQYQAEIAQVGYDDWLRQFESAEQWRARCVMAATFIEAALT